MDMTLDNLYYDDTDNSLAYECMLNEDWSIVDIAYEAADQATQTSLLGRIREHGEKIATWIKEQVALLQDKLSSMYEEKVANSFKNKLSATQSALISKSTKKCALAYNNAFSSTWQRGLDILNKCQNAANQMPDNTATTVTNANPASASVKNETTSLGDKPPKLETANQPYATNGAEKSSKATDAVMEAADAEDKVDANVEASSSGDLDAFVNETQSQLTEVVKTINSEYTTLTKGEGGNAIQQAKADELSGHETEVVGNIKECFRVVRGPVQAFFKFANNFTNLVKSISKAAGNLSAKGNNVNTKKASLVTKMKKCTDTLVKCIEAVIKITLHPYRLIFWVSKTNSGSTADQNDVNPEETK